ncbi:MAG: sensor histidine kinase [Solirubrobacteraceae bacterium]
MLGRLTIRVKLTIAFAAAMGVVLAATGVFLYLSFRSELDQTIDRGLRSQAYGVQALIMQSDGGLRSAGQSLLRNGQSFAQVIIAGHVSDWTPPLGRRPVLSPADMAVAHRATIIVERASPPGLRGRARLLASTVPGQDGRPTTIVVGTLLSGRDHTLSVLMLRLALGGAGALLLASAVGYALTAAALRTIESMRRRAQTLSVSRPGERLPVPRARDELWRLGTTLNEMLARSEAAFARERAFVADASHELRTPLSILRAELEIALRGEDSLAELRAAVVSASEETERLSRLVDDLLVIARADQGQLMLRCTPVRVADLMGGIAARFGPRAQQARRTLAVSASPGLESVADPARIEQALTNMVDNALRYGAGAVVLSAAQTNGTVELHVTDEGQGFPPGFLDDAFERFARVDAARSTDGSGLGLSIVRSIARAHSGEAHAVNRASGGADVWLTIPGQEAGPASVAAQCRGAAESPRTQIA